ncbi:MAG: hypothetical protein AABZ53_03665 [Planctomycetota bacterium]
MNATTITSRLFARAASLVVASGTLGACASTHATVTFNAEAWQRLEITGWSDDQGNKLKKMPARVTIRPARTPGAHHETPRHGNSEAGGVPTSEIDPGMAAGTPGSSMFVHNYAWGRTAPAGECSSDSSSTCSIVITNGSAKMVEMSYDLFWSCMADTFATIPERETAWAQASTDAAFRKVFPAPPAGPGWPVVHITGGAEAKLPGWGRGNWHDEDAGPDSTFPTSIKIGAGEAYMISISSLAKGGAKAWLAGGTPTPGTALSFGTAGLFIAARRRRATSQLS